MSADCLVYVNPNGNYVCRENTLQGSCPKLVRAANLPAPIPVLVSVTGDIDDEFTPTEQVLENGVPLILLPGAYRLDFDCADYAGVAPETGAVTICCEEIDLELATSLNAQTKLCELVDLLALSTDTGALATVVEELVKLCEKIEITNQELIASQAAQLACLVAIKEKPDPLVPLSTVCY